MASAANDQTREYWIIQWLARQSPAIWHGYIERAEWNFGDFSPFFWIARNPACDKGTAAKMFWLAEPSYQLANAPESRLAKLCLEIAKNWSDGFYTSSRFDFGGDYMDEQRRKWIPEFEMAGHKIPVEIAEPIRGTESYPLIGQYDLTEVEYDFYVASGKQPPAHFLEKHNLVWENGTIVGERPVTEFKEYVTVERKLTGAQLASVKEALAKMNGGKGPFTRRFV